jgi:hypothetical protein
MNIVLRKKKIIRKLTKAFFQIFLSIACMIESKPNGYFYYGYPQTYVQYPQIPHAFLYANSGLQNVPNVQVQPKLVQPNQPQKDHTIVIDSESGVVVSCIDGSCNYAEENIIPSTALLCNFSNPPLNFKYLKNHIDIKTILHKFAEKTN